MRRTTKWQIKKPDENAVKSLVSALGIAEITGKVLVARGIDTEDKAKAFLSVGAEGLFDPFMLPDMDIGADMIVKAIESGRKITVFGDYDVDGITASFIVYDYLKRICGAEVGIYIPSRESEGYGLSKGAVDYIKSTGTSLIVTVDTGVTAVKEVEYARDNGISIVVTDHHECSDNIPETAVVDAKRFDSEYPFIELSGAGIALKLITALEALTKRIDTYAAATSENVASYTDCAALGTVADVVPLVSENRIIVAEGLKRLNKTSRIGLLKLIEAAGFKGKTLTAESISFGLAPRINSAGRMESAMIAFELLCTDSPARAEKIANHLCDCNRLRQSEENTIFDEACHMIDGAGNAAEKRVFVLHSPRWHPGIIGIVASKIVEKYATPAMLVAEQPDGKTGRGSGRSVPGLPLADALDSCDDILIKHGGHDAAAGFEIEISKIHEFEETLEEYAKAIFPNNVYTNFITADCEISLSDVSADTARQISALAPFGAANESPLFFINGLHIDSMTPVGAGKHTKMYLSDGNNGISGILFRRNLPEEGFESGDPVLVMASLEEDSFNGGVQLSVKYIEPSLDVINTALGDKETYGKMRFMLVKEQLPTRDDFGKLYLYLKNVCRYKSAFNLATLRDKAGIRSDMPTFLILPMLDILAEKGLISCVPNTRWSVTVSMKEATVKVDLTDSDIYRNLLYSVK